MATLTGIQIILMAGLLITGSINTLSRKAQYDSVAEGYNSEEHSFNHPWFQIWMLCSAQTLCLIGLPFQRRREKQEFKHSEKNQRPTVTTISVNINDETGENDTKASQTVSQHTEPIIEIEIGQPVNASLCQWILVIPACFCVANTALSGIGLLYVDASIMLMLKGSGIIFAGIFSQIFLKKKLKLTHWLGIIIVISGLVLTGCSSVLKNQDHKAVGGKTVTGIILILCAQVITGVKVVLEEAIIKKRNLHPLHVVGMTGLYGFAMMSFVVLPILYFIPAENAHGFHENSIDALYQISNSIQLLILCIFYVASVAFCNYFAMAVMKSLTAIHRTLIDACRAIVVWIVGLILFYGFDKNFGEPFDNSYGILQIIGFFGIVLGTVVYNQLIDIPKCVPCLQAIEKKDDQSETGDCDNIQYTIKSSDLMEISKFENK